MSHKPELGSENAKQSGASDKLLCSIVILDGVQRLSLLDSIEALPLSVRARNALMRGGIKTVDALLGISEFEIRNIRNVGQKTLGEIQAVKERLQFASDQRVLTEQGVAIPREESAPIQATAEAQSRTVPFYRGHLLVVELRQTNQDLSVAIGDDSVTKQLNGAGIYTTGDLLKTRLHQVVKLEGISIESWKEILKNFKLRGAIRCQRLPIQRSPPYEVERLGLSVRTANRLLNVGITDLQQIAKLTFADVLSVSHFGPHAFGELLAALRDKLDGINIEPCVEEDKLTGFKSVLQNSIIDKLAAFEVKEPGDLGQYTFEDLILKAKLTYGEVQQVSSGLSVTGISLSTRWPRQPLVSQSDYQYLKRMQIPLDQINISRLALATSLEEGLRSLGIVTVDVAACQSKTALNVALGTHAKEHIDILAKSLKEYFAWLPTQSSWDDELADKGIGPLYLVRFKETTLERIVESLLSHISREKHRKLIRLRYGLDGGGRRTLQQVGEQLDLTRERIRQMQKRALDQSKKGTTKGLVRALYISIEDEMKAHGGLMSVPQIGEHIADLTDVGEIDLDGAVSLLLSLKRTQFVEVKKKRLWGLQDAALNLVRPLSQELIRILQAIHAPLSQQNLIERLSQTEWYADNKNELSTEFIQAGLSTDDRFERIEDDQWGLARWKKGRTDEIVMALRKLGKPSHFTEITRVANEMLPPSQRASSRVYHAQLGNKPHLFAWVGSGTFGLIEWGLKRARFYVDIAEELLQERGEPMTFEEILPVINGEREASPSSILFMLGTNPRFRQYPDNKYGLATWSENPEDESDESGDSFLDDLKQHLFDDLFDEDDD